MGVTKDTYDIIKDLLSEAKKLKNYNFVEMVIEVQQRFFDLNRENQEMNVVIKKHELLIDQLKNKLEKLDLIEKENVRLKGKLLIFEKTDDLAFLDGDIDAKYEESQFVVTSGMAQSKVNVLQISLKKIFLEVAPELLSTVNNVEFNDLFNKKVNGVYSYLEEKTIGKIKAKFMEHDLIEINESTKGEVKIKLTEFGRKVLNKLNDL